MWIVSARDKSGEWWPLRGHYQTPSPQDGGTEEQVMSEERDSAARVGEEYAFDGLRAEWEEDGVCGESLSQERATRIITGAPRLLAAAKALCLSALSLPPCAPGMVNLDRDLVTALWEEVRKIEGGES
jgi:hypothetical protein